MEPGPAGARLPAAMLSAMRQNPLGRSELTVSAVGLGCNNFGRRLDKDGTRAVIDAALDARHHVPRHRGHLRRRTARPSSSSASCSRVAATASSSRPSSAWTWARNGDVPRGSRAYARRAVEASLAPAADRRDRPLLPPRAGRRHAARGEHRRARRARRRGEDPHVRRVQPRRGAAARGRARPATTRLVALQNEYNLLEREDEAEVLPLRARARGRLHPVLPARERRC